MLSKNDLGISSTEGDGNTAILIMIFDLPKQSNFEQKHGFFKDNYYQ
jgi:hypothetical protein